MDALDWVIDHYFDGHDGAPIPVWHSLEAFNQIAQSLGKPRITAQEIADLSRHDPRLERPLASDRVVDKSLGRDIYLRRHAGAAPTHLNWNATRMQPFAGLRSHTSRTHIVALLAVSGCLGRATPSTQPTNTTAAFPGPTARATPSPRTPSAPHERLTFFEGTWTVEELAPSRRFREQCAWLPEGRRHMVCRNRSVTASGEPREGMSLFSYRAADSTYLYYGLGTSGSIEVLQGRATPDGWEFQGTRGVGPEPGRERVRVQIVRLAARRFRFVEQTARGSSAFSAGDTIHYRPLAPTEWDR